MDPTSFTQTSFCGSQVDNITENEAKDYILTQMGILCGGTKYNSRYAKIYNPQYKRNLKNPHIVCLKSSGTPYLLFLTQINETNYCFLIDKKVKEGYEYPKIFILPYRWTSEMYQGTLLECELIRDRNRKWSIGINDIYYGKGKNMNQTIVMDRLSCIHKLLQEGFLDSEFTKTCKPFVKRYFDYKDIPDIVETFVPTLPYDIRGFYFVPLKCSYSKLLNLLPRDNPMNLRKGQQGQQQQTGPKPIKPNVRKKKSPHVGLGDALEQVQVEQALAISKMASGRLFRIMKTMKPDVYEVYSEDKGEFHKQGTLLVQTAECSKKLFETFQGKSQSDEVRIQCVKNERFDKWEPM
jgi:hypothetical protein